MIGGFLSNQAGNEGLIGTRLTLLRCADFLPAVPTDAGTGFRLGWITVPDANAYRFGSEEVKQTVFRLDGVLVPPPESPLQPIVFIEVQFQPDKEVYSWFFSEIFLYLRHHEPKNPWQAVVIYPYRRTEQNHSGHHEALLKSTQVHLIYLINLLAVAFDRLLWPAGSPTQSIGGSAAGFLAPERSGSLVEGTRRTVAARVIFCLLSAESSTIS